MQDPSPFSAMKQHQFPEPEQLKCPRCDSPNTKFCYYNNYNLSQPRHYCKSCRRYWTKGGALRNIPVGGGTRKNSKRSSSSKRSNSDPNSDPGRTPPRRVPEASSSSTSTSTTSATSALQLVANGNSSLGGLSGPDGSGDPTRMYGLEPDQDRKGLLDLGGSFSSLLASNGQFGNIFEGLNPNGPGLKMVDMGGFGEDLNVGSVQNPGLDVQVGDRNVDGSGGGGGGGGGGGESYLQGGEWGNSNGWPDLAIYTPGSSFQ